MFNPNTGGWVKGAQLRGVRAQETTTPFLLDPTSLVLRPGADLGTTPFVAGTDYDVDLNWGTFGRKAGGALSEGQPVFASYRYAPLRLDAIVLEAGGQVAIRVGEPRPAAPQRAKLRPGDRHLGNVWITGRLTRLEPRHLFPLLEAAYPEPPKPSPTVAEELLPRTMERLRGGGTLRVLAWGDRRHAHRRRCAGPDA